jgi:hypothetical protein
MFPCAFLKRLSDQKKILHIAPDSLMAAGMDSEAVLLASKTVISPFGSRTKPRVTPDDASLKIANHLSAVVVANNGGRQGVRRIEQNIACVIDRGWNLALRAGP